MSSYEEKRDANAKQYSPLENVAVVGQNALQRKTYFPVKIPKKQMLWRKDLQTVRQDGL
jgi:hypothetical protein